MTTQATFKDPNLVPKDLSVTPHKIAILAFNTDGFIDKFLFDDTERTIHQLGLEKSKQIPLPIYATANLLFQLSQQILLIPGERLEDDEQIINYIKEKISPTIDNPDIVITEIITAWNSLATHELAQKYRALVSTGENCILQSNPVYEPMFHDYISQYLRSIQFSKEMSWILFQANELFISTREGTAFSTNQYEKIQHLITTMEACKQDIPDSAGLIDMLKSNLHREESRWFISVRGLIETEIRGLMSDDTVDQKQLKAALLKLIQQNFNSILNDAFCIENFEYTLPALDNPSQLCARLHFAEGETKPSDTEIRQAIIFTINSVIQEENYSLTPSLPSESSSSSSSLIEQLDTRLVAPDSKNDTDLVLTPTPPFQLNHAYNQAISQARNHIMEEDAAIIVVDCVEKFVSRCCEIL